MSGKKHCRIEARLNEVEEKWLDVYADRRDLNRSEAVRELIRLAYLDDFQDAAIRIERLEAEVMELKRRVGKLELEKRREHAARRKWMRVATKRGYVAEIKEKERIIAILQDTLSNLEVKT